MSPLPASGPPRRGTNTTQFDNTTFGDIPNYRVGRELGRGGMSVVYAAKSKETDEEVAVKILYPYYAGNRDLVNRLRREIDILQKVQHPNIVCYLDSGEQRSCYYYIMEFLQGESLEARLDREGRLPEKEACRIILAVALGLAEAHRHQVFHRDIKPGNIFLTVDDQVKLVDFGLAKDETDAYQTQMGLVIGTPLYLSPEQARGERDVDGRVDIYSLGITLFHGLTGHIPFQDLIVPLILTKKTVETVPSVKEFNPQLSDNVTDIVRGMCDRDLKMRYPDIEIVIEDLERHLNDERATWVGQLSKRRTIVTKPVHASTSSVLSDPILKSLMLDSSELTEMLDYPADNVIFLEGDKSKDVYLLLAGDVEVLKAGVRITTLNQPGTFFGEMSGLLGLPRSTTIRTHTAARLARIDHATFEGFLKNFPTLNYQLAVMLAERLQRTTEDYYSLRNRFRFLKRHLNLLECFLEEPQVEDR